MEEVLQNNIDGDDVRFIAMEMDQFTVKAHIDSHPFGNLYLCVDNLEDSFFVKSYRLNDNPEEINFHFERRRRVLMQGHKNIASMTKGIYAEQSNLLYEVFPLPRCSMLQNIVLNKDIVLSLRDIKVGVRDALKAVHHYHSRGVAHGSITPSSFLLDKDSSRLLLTSFLFPSYRAPELLLSPDDAPTYASDMWSVGCVFVEAVARAPIFINDDDELNEIFRVMVGDDQMKWPTSAATLPMLKDVHKRDVTKALSAYVPPEIGEVGFELLSMMLRLHPLDRISAEEALAHSFLDDIRGLC